MDNITGLEKKVDNRVNVNFTEFKQVGITEEEGVKTAVFEGIANVMNAVDLGGDVIHEGAFTKTLREKGGKVPFLIDHRYSVDSYAGMAYLEEKGDELKARVELLLEDDGIKNVAGEQFYIKAKHAQKNNDPFGMSIGFSIPKGKSDYIEGIRHIYEVVLYELSGTMFPMSDNSRIQAIKSNDKKNQILNAIEDIKTSLSSVKPSEDTSHKQAESVLSVLAQIKTNITQ